MNVIPIEPQKRSPVFPSAPPRLCGEQKMGMTVILIKLDYRKMTCYGHVVGGFLSRNRSGLNAPVLFDILIGIDVGWRR
jgi:hypothetical protein